MRQRAFIPVTVPPVQPAGILNDHRPDLQMRFQRTTEPVRAGARIRIWGGYEMQPKWLPEDGGRAGVLGTVVRYLGVHGGLGKEAVVQLDRPLVCEGLVGDFVVLRLKDNFSHWTSGETVSVELCEMEPHMRFLRRRAQGAIIETSAICELL